MFDLSHLGNARVDAFLPNEDFLVVERGDAREIVDASNPAVRIPIKNCDFYMQSDSETLFVSESVIGGARVDHLVVVDGAAGAPHRRDHTV